MKKIASILFHRTAMVAFLLLLQIGLLLWTVLRFSVYFFYVYMACLAFSVAEVLYIVN